MRSFPTYQTIVLMLAILALAIAISFFGSWRDRRDFKSYGYRRVLELLAANPLTEEEILEQDPAISSHGVISHHLWRMEKKKLIASAERSNGTYRFSLTDKGRHELRRLQASDAALQKKSTEAA